MSRVDELSDEQLAEVLAQGVLRRDRDPTSEVVHVHPVVLAEAVRRAAERLRNKRLRKEAEQRTGS